MTRYELYIYKITGLLLSYSISYLTRPKKEYLGLLKAFFTDRSSSVAEQRIKDNLRRSSLFTNYLKPVITKIFFNKKKSI